MIRSIIQMSVINEYTYIYSSNIHACSDAIFGHGRMAMLFSVRGDAIFGARGPSTYSRNPIDCRDAIFGHGDLHFRG